LILRATDLGLALEFSPLVLIVMNIVYAMASYPLGYLSDRFPREWFLLTGLVALVGADLLLALGGGLPVAFLGIALWGLHMGLTQGVLSALVADTCGADLRGTAYGLFNLFSALALLLASLVAGILWDKAGPAVTFFTGAGLSVLSFVVFLATGRFWSEQVRQ
jgi:MFS family permease